ncbi:hypothetical protein MAR_014753 [Mya arenaria]|uniref:Transposase Helix-turn-helix domain-containing protein n=1 Tax=Mya arenaria TaxID=6604 RepID=A0ABY7FIR9_MYAAR|nr:hypothetical protein MAR_014753 [Mya arenaria]
MPLGLLEDENDKDIPNRLPAPATENMPSSDKADENRLLDMLALAAENESLKQHLAKLILENEKLQQRKTNTTKIKPGSAKLNIGKTRKKDEFVYYTDLNSEQFSSFYNFLVPPRVQELPFHMMENIGCQKNIAMEDQRLLVMTKLRQNFDFVHIGNLFSISQQDASALFKNWIQYMFLDVHRLRYGLIVTL